jgi:type I restriction enzyme S subunit
MSKWEMVRLGDIGKVITGNTPKTNDRNNYSACDIPFFKPGDFVEYVVSPLLSAESYVSNYAKNQIRLLPPMSILVTCIGIIGKVGIVKNECTCNQQINALIPDKKLCDERYLAYAILQNNHHLKHIANAAVVPIINKTQFGNIKIPFPALETQQKIADALDRATALIEKRKAQIEKLDLLVKSRFVEMFGELKKQKWTLERLDAIATTRLGKMLDAKHQTGTCAYPYLANFNVQWFRFNLERINKMDFNDADRKEFSLKDGDLLICEGGEVGRTAIWHGEQTNCYFQKALHRVRCNPELCVPEYMAWVMYFKAHCGQFDGVASVATIAHLPGVKLKALAIPLPPLKLQQCFADFVHQVDRRKNKLMQSLENLERNYNSLMQKCFRGEIF